MPADYSLRSRGPLHLPPKSTEEPLKVTKSSSLQARAVTQDDFFTMSAEKWSELLTAVTKNQVPDTTIETWLEKINNKNLDTLKSLNKYKKLFKKVVENQRSRPFLDRLRSALHGIFTKQSLVARAQTALDKIDAVIKSNTVALLDKLENDDQVQKEEIIGLFERGINYKLICQGWYYPFINHKPKTELTSLFVAAVPLLHGLKRNYERAYIINNVRNISPAEREHVIATAAQVSLILGEKEFFCKAKTVKELGRITRDDRESVLAMLPQVTQGVERFQEDVLEAVISIPQNARESVCRAAARLMTNVPSGIERKYILQAVEATAQDKREGVTSFVERLIDGMTLECSGYDKARMINAVAQMSEKQRANVSIDTFRLMWLLR